MAALVRRAASRVVLSRSYPRLVLLVMASVLLLSGCMLSPLFQAPAAVMTGIAVLLGLAACSGGGGGGGGGGDNTVTHGNWPVIVDLSDLNLGQHGVMLDDTYGGGAGFAVASGRDVNGDGVQDLVIGAPYAVGAFENSLGGTAYVVFGHSGITALAGANGSFGSTAALPLSLLNTVSAAGFIAQGAADHGYAGWSVALVPSINGDTKADVLIGEPHDGYASTSYDRHGAAWVIFGPSGGTRSKVTLDTGSMTTADGFRIRGHDVQGLGFSVAGGDFNKDGKGDLLVGATDLADTYDGQGFVWFGTGSAPGSTSINAYAYSDSGAPGAFFIRDGYSYTHYMSVTNIGDINGDGIDDFAVGDGDARQVMVVFGNSGMASSPTVPRSFSSLNGSNGFVLYSATGNLGNLVLGVGDVNGDGHDDLLVQAQDGRFHVIFGHSSGYTWSSTIPLGNSISSPQGFTIYSSYVGSNGSVAAGDLNGDGVNDIVIGDPGLKWYDYATYSTFYPGGVFVIFGGSGLGASGTFNAYDMIYNDNGSTGFLVTGPVDNGHFGHSVAVGDLNGDGLKDLIIGSAYQVDGDNHGRVWVIFGPSSGTNLPSLSPDDGEFYSQVL